jgi:hypothetical protein
MLEVVFEFIFEIICNITGEIVLWVFTLGRRRPFEIKNDGIVSALIGALFWVVIAGGIAMFFLLK